MIFGVLGFAGSIGQRHAKNLMNIGHQVIGYDPIFPNPLTRDEVIEKSDAVIICSPTKHHFVDMVDCHGKHIFVEKPIAFDAPPAAVKGFCMGKAYNNEIVAVGFMCRFHDCVRQAKLLIDGGYIGEIGWAEFYVDQYTDKPPYLRDGVIRNWASHEIDLALHLLGPAFVSDLRHIEAPDGHDSVVEFGMRHDRGCYSTIHADYVTNPERRGFRIVGTNGIIEADLVARTLKCGDNEWKMTDSWDRNYESELRFFIERIWQQNIDNPLATGMDGAAVHEIVMQVRDMAGLEDKE